MASEIAMCSELWKYKVKNCCRKSRTSTATNHASLLLESQLYCL
jgi:hypothetical protein